LEYEYEKKGPNLCQDEWILHDENAPCHTTLPLKLFFLKKKQERHHCWNIQLVQLTWSRVAFHIPKSKNLGPRHSSGG
jgi:hypothetical protein